MPTADLALLLLSLVSLLALSSGGAALLRLARRLLVWSDERAIQRERLKQEQLKTALLEEQLRNEILKDLSRKPTDRER